MADAVLRIFSYLPNPRVWKSQIAAELSGVEVEVIGAAPGELAGWLWDYNARPLARDERDEDAPFARTSRRGFSGTLFKTDAFLAAHPFGTVPAAFGPGGEIGIFESNSILRAVARAGGSGTGLYGRDAYEASRIDSFLDASLVFAREAQVYLLAVSEMTAELHARMASAFEFYLEGTNRALSNGRFVAGDELTIADVSFVCDLAQFLHERRGRDALEAKGFAPVSDDAHRTFPHALRHLFELGAQPAFATYVARALDRHRDALAVNGAG